MAPEYPDFPFSIGYDPTETVQENLAEINQRLQPLFLSRAFQLGELIAAGKDLPALPDIDTVQAICEHLFHSLQDKDHYTSALYSADLITLCNEIAVAYPENYDNLFSAVFGQHALPAQEAQSRIAYVANSYTEQAFMELKGLVKQHRVAYFHHFDDVCQEVNNGLCEYGILPVESTAEGLMAGLFRLIELYDLRICALCRIPTANNGYTSFALIRKTLAPVQPQPQHCLDFLYTPASPDDVGTLISAAALCGHTLLHTATYMGNDSEIFRLRFGVNPDALYPFLIYLWLFCPDITPIGIYMIK